MSSSKYGVLLLLFLLLATGAVALASSLQPTDQCSTVPEIVTPNGGTAGAQYNPQTCIAAFSGQSGANRSAARPERNRAGSGQDLG